MDSKELDEIKKQVMAVDCPTILDPRMPNTTVMDKRIFLDEILKKRQGKTATIKQVNRNASESLSQQAKDDFLQEMLQQRLASMNKKTSPNIAEDKKEEQIQEQDVLEFLSETPNDEIDTLNFIKTEQKKRVTK